MRAAGVLGLALVAAGGPVLAQQQPPEFNLKPPATSFPSTAGVALPGDAQNYLAPGVKPDIAFGAFQRGFYITAFREAMKRIEADSKDGPAMTLIGELYRDGLGIKRSPEEAVRWYRLAADRGDPQAAYSLAIAYLSGNGVKEDRKAALPLLQKAAAAGNPGALYNLGLTAVNGDIQDFAKGADYFRRAAELGNVDAAYALGLLYKQGRGVQQDPVRAAEWLKKAADEHLVAAQIDYAIMLFNGEGIPKDEAAAARYFQKAAATNNPVAANRLARLLVTGRGIQRNMIEAMKWHILARTAGVKDEWLDSQLNSLSARDRAAVEEALRKQVGGT